MSRNVKNNLRRCYENVMYVFGFTSCLVVCVCVWFMSRSYQNLKIFKKEKSRKKNSKKSKLKKKTKKKLKYLTNDIYNFGKKYQK